MNDENLSNLYNSEEVICLEGLFFIRLQAIKKNTRIASSTIDDLYKFVSTN